MAGYIKLHAPLEEEDVYAVVDEEMEFYVQQLGKWYIDKASSRVVKAIYENGEGQPSSFISLAHFIMRLRGVKPVESIESGTFNVKHVNGNTLDCRFSNLICIPKRLELQHSQSRSNTGLRGISVKDDGTYCVRVGPQGQQFRGTAHSIEEAKHMYNERAIEVYGPLAKVHSLEGMSQRDEEAYKKRLIQARLDRIRTVAGKYLYLIGNLEYCDIIAQQEHKANELNITS